MKRSVLVAVGTAAGVTAVVSYHAASPSSAVSLASTSTSSAARSTTTSGSASASRSASDAGHASSTTAARTSTTTSSSTTASSSASTRSALGEAVSYQYGELQVKVTEHGGRITNVSVARLEVTDPHSESIDEYAIPQLRTEVLSAQSGHIDGVSGASYTSQAYETSVQSALDKLA